MDNGSSDSHWSTASLSARVSTSLRSNHHSEGKPPAKRRRTLVRTSVPRSSSAAAIASSSLPVSTKSPSTDSRSNPPSVVTEDLSDDPSTDSETTHRIAPRKPRKRSKYVGSAESRPIPIADTETTDLSTPITTGSHVQVDRTQPEDDETEHKSKKGIRKRRRQKRSSADTSTDEEILTETMHLRRSGRLQSRRELHRQNLDDTFEETVVDTATVKKKPKPRTKAREKERRKKAKKRSLRRKDTRMEGKSLDFDTNADDSDLNADSDSDAASALRTSSPTAVRQLDLDIDVFLKPTDKAKSNMCEGEIYELCLRKGMFKTANQLIHKQLSIDMKVKSSKVDFKDVARMRKVRAALKKWNDEMFFCFCQCYARFADNEKAIEFLKSRFVPQCELRKEELYAKEPLDTTVVERSGRSVGTAVDLGTEPWTFVRVIAHKEIAVCLERRYFLNDALEWTDADYNVWFFYAARYAQAFARDIGGVMTANHWYKKEVSSFLEDCIKDETDRNNEHTLHFYRCWALVEKLAVGLLNEGKWKRFEAMIGCFEANRCFRMAVKWIRKAMHESKRERDNGGSDNTALLKKLRQLRIKVLLNAVLVIGSIENRYEQSYVLNEVLAMATQKVKDADDEVTEKAKALITLLTPVQLV